MLRELKCFDAFENLSPLGRILARLPIDARIGKMMILGSIFGCGDTVATVAAYSSVSSEAFVPREGGLTTQQKELAGQTHSDHIAVLMAQEMYATARHSGEDVRVCDEAGLHLPTMQTMFETKRQLLDLLLQAGFPEETMRAVHVEPNEMHSKLGMTLALTAMGMYPNVCYHKQKRKVLTTDWKSALIHRTSVNCTRMAVTFPYPFFVFGEKNRTQIVFCKQLSMVSPIHLLLFGAKKVEMIGTNTVRLDGWLSYEMNPYEASLITAVRPALDRIVEMAAQSPDDILRFGDPIRNLIAAVEELCAMDAGDHGLVRNTPVPATSKFARRDESDHCSDREFEINPFAAGGPSNARWNNPCADDDCDNSDSDF